MTLTERMAEYTVDYRIENRSDAVKAARLNFLDAVGCIMAGTMTKQFQLVKEYAGLYRTISQAGILGFEGRVDAGHAAMAHAVAAHACDFDDMCTHLNGHPSAVVVPVVLALEELYEKKGRELSLIHI